MGELYWDTELANRWGATLNSALGSVRCGAVMQRWIKKTSYLAPKRGQFSYRKYSLWLNISSSYLNGHPKFLFIWFLELLVPFHSPNVFLGLLVKNSLWSIGSSGMPPLPSALSRESSCCTAARLSSPDLYARVSLSKQVFCVPSSWPSRIGLWTQAMVRLDSLFLLAMRLLLSQVPSASW